MTAAPNRILDHSLGSLLELTADESPAFAGGAAAATSLAAAAGLVAMCARRSRGHWDDAPAAAGQAEVLRTRATRLIAESAAAYDLAAELLRPEARDPAGATPARDWQLGSALARAADSPLRCAEVAADVAELAAEVASAADSGFRAEAVAACLLAEAAARIGAHLVEINLATGDDDERLERSRAAAGRAARCRESVLAVAKG